MKNSKFGIRNERLNWFLNEIRKDSLLNLVGVHCHLGSTIKEVRIFRDATEIMLAFMRAIQAEGFPVRHLNIGGGLGIDYERTGEEIPTPSHLIDSIRDLLPAMILRLLLNQVVLLSAIPLSLSTVLRG